MKKRVFFALAFLALHCVQYATAEQPLRVVATLTSYAALAQAVGGQIVEVSFIVPPRFNPHYYEPRPSDVLKIKRADLLLHSGLDLEAWRRPLLDAAARSELRSGAARELDLSTGITLLEIPSAQPSRSAGDIHQFGNPHYWTDPHNALIMARNIATKLQELRPEAAEYIAGNLQSFEGSLKSKMLEWTALMRPFRGMWLIAYHNEWPYMLNFLGLKAERFVEPKPGIPPGPQHLEELIEYIHNNNVRALIQASYFPLNAGEFLKRRTGLQIVVLCHNVGELPQCTDYISMLDYNIRRIAEALS